MKRITKVLEVTGETVENLLELVLNYWQVFALGLGVLLLLEVNGLKREVRRAVDANQSREVAK